MPIFFHIIEKLCDKLCDFRWKRDLYSISRELEITMELGTQQGSTLIQIAAFDAGGSISPISQPWLCHAMTSPILLDKKEFFFGPAKTIFQPIEKSISLIYKGKISGKAH